MVRGDRRAIWSGPRRPKSCRAKRECLQCSNVCRMLLSSISKLEHWVITCTAQLWNQLFLWLGWDCARIDWLLTRFWLHLRLNTWTYLQMLLLQCLIASLKQTAVEVAALLKKFEKHCCRGSIAFSNVRTARYDKPIELNNMLFKKQLTFPKW